ncbi:MAG: helix-turn-helix domain-containing protein [Kiritimatiellae bacterium]|nr:helix-turn-helix domain-containing protein [Kiritimatiellia bacterium]
METMGQVFRAARERKRISVSQAAIKTRIKIQHIEMMERDDFSQMPAPAYARGFIRMYAEFLGLESGPLVEEYNELHQPGARVRQPSRAAEPRPQPREDETDEHPSATTAPAVGARVRQILAAVASVFTLENLKRAGFVLAMGLICWLLVLGLKQCARRVQEDDARPPVAGFKKGVPAIVEEPADAYLPLPPSPGEKP